MAALAMPTATISHERSEKRHEHDAEEHGREPLRGDRQSERPPGSAAGPPAPQSGDDGERDEHGPFESEMTVVLGVKRVPRADQRGNQAARGSPVSRHAA